MEYRPRPGPGDECCAVSRAIVRELFGPRLRPFVVCDAAEDVAAQRHQFDERGLTTNIELAGEGLPLLAVDLRLQIAERERHLRSWVTRHRQPRRLPQGHRVWS